MSEEFPTLRWIGDANGHLELLDQTRLPGETIYLECRTAEDVWHAIKRLSVRGAPAIGVAAAYGVCVGVNEGRSVADVCDYLATSRPTAVNLFWALGRMRSAASRGQNLFDEARAIHAEDQQQCSAMAQHGAELLQSHVPTDGGILTHCNTGSLCASGDGTALAVVFEFARRGNKPHVWADETRPLLQGARLTMWELMQRNIDATLICDSVAAQVMREGKIQAVITGADRIAANGDTANKIGTYSVAMLARAHRIPFYVAAPVTTFDLAISNGAEIPIEQRSADEVAEGLGLRTAPANARVYNPAFDVTPAELIAAIITDRGIIQPVSVENVRQVVAT